MSGINGSRGTSILPEEIEAAINNAREMVNSLNLQKETLEKEIKLRTAEEAEVARKLNDRNNEYASVTAAFEIKKKEFSDKELQLSQKESALNVYANALEEKEKKITKYLAIFESMKDVIRK